MADHHGRDIEGDILRVLARQGLPITVRAIQSGIEGRQPTTETIRRHLHRMSYRRIPFSGDAIPALVEQWTTTKWQLTDEGRRRATREAIDALDRGRVAEARGQRRAEG